MKSASIRWPAGGGNVLLYPGGQYMRVVQPLRQPGQTARDNGAIELHMPGKRSAAVRRTPRQRATRCCAAAPRPARTAAAAPRAPRPSPSNAPPRPAAQSRRHRPNAPLPHPRRPPAPAATMPAMAPSARRRWSGRRPIPACAPASPSPTARSSAKADAAAGFHSAARCRRSPA